MASSTTPPRTPPPPPPAPTTLAAARTHHATLIECALPSSPLTYVHTTNTPSELYIALLAFIRQHPLTFDAANAPLPYYLSALAPETAMLVLDEVSLPAGLRPSRLELHDGAKALGLETVRLIETWPGVKGEFANPNTRLAYALLLLEDVAQALDTGAGLPRYTPDPLPWLAGNVMVWLRTVKAVAVGVERLPAPLPAAGAAAVVPVAGAVQGGSGGAAVATTPERRGLRRVLGWLRRG
ncbi:uncharacterized protein K452DRAFT_313325 [Aplosporella prunicola CBS 121167]|uniref:Uncharacterized protein n=1 Tax=Aplosporella prunicola CBS 121167 TaxID=1176127 RepID=A0A6A6AXF4_9PEZI|nr:uncharacterized protein K452DRAFT_313325 [Aplosporella prunicola CBS 121167]KAF2136296.1 hypothetical protein K452DRAFT_313325 [Aplosporella prunicola CBS 121167]